MAEHDGVADDRTLAVPELQDAQLGRLVRHLADAVVIADAMGWSRVIRSTGTGCLRFLLSTVTVVRSRLRSRSRCSRSMIRRARSVSLR